MSAASQKHIQLALALPARLRTFLARYPPAAILPTGADPEASKTAYQRESPNPFQPTKHPVTGRWHDPKYSLRRQAELVKIAREHHVEELLPFSAKGTEERLRKRVELGLRVKGTGVGQQVKGHKHERQLVAKYVSSVFAVVHVGLWYCRTWMLTSGFRMEKRRKAMLEMPDLIREWKKVSAPSEGEHNYIASADEATTGRKAELGQVPQIEGLLGARNGRVRTRPCIECIISNVQHPPSTAVQLLRHSPLGTLGFIFKMTSVQSSLVVSRRSMQSLLDGCPRLVQLIDAYYRLATRILQAFI